MESSNTKWKIRLFVILILQRVLLYMFITASIVIIIDVGNYLTTTAGFFAHPLRWDLLCRDICAELPDGPADTAGCLQETHYMF